MKKIFVSIFLILILIISIFIIIFNRFNSSVIINYVENKIGLEIQLINESIWSFYPDISYENSKVNIVHKNSALNIDNANIIINKNYWPLSPIKIFINSPIIHYEGMEMRDININAKYLYNTLHISNFNGKLVDGYVNSNGIIDLDDPYSFNFQGLFKNISLNALLNQSNIAKWDRVNIKLSSPNFQISGKKNINENFLNSIKGKIPINGSVYFISSEEERFGAAFLSLLVEKIPKLSSISQSVDFILSTYANIPSSINGIINISDGHIKSEEILIKNKKGKSTLRGNYNYIDNIIKSKVYFFKKNEIFLEASLEGKIENPKILVGGKVFIQNEEEPMQDIKNLLESGINKFIEKLLSVDD